MGESLRGSGEEIYESIVAGASVYSLIFYQKFNKHGNGNYLLSIISYASRMPWERILMWIDRDVSVLLGSVNKPQTGVWG